MWQQAKYYGWVNRWVELDLNVPSVTGIVTERKRLYPYMHLEWYTEDSSTELPEHFPGGRVGQSSKWPSINGNYIKKLFMERIWAMHTIAAYDGGWHGSVCFFG